MSFLTKSIVALLIGSSLGFPENAVAQCSEDENPGSVSSDGIQGTVLSISPMKSNTRSIALNINIRNSTKYTAHILTVGNFNLSSDSGAQIIKQEIPSPGLNICKQDSTEKRNPDACLRAEGNDINTYNEIPACGSIKGTMYYLSVNGIDIKAGDNILNYTYKAIVRFSPAEPDPLLADKPASPPRIVTLVFPPISVQ
jgi:hypothetical protein